ncbi:hypothetical protein [Vibrio paucivorans]|uniref:Uncharacterized protein n=1 Tax=Vibrio paucivorans TaxID=2829489 RepID=A0A9X3CEC4_9VIBR|nr:hypothetical protein [Vibrio paucivorans]MCW8334034.1 hypothetical protein [Vibrio paucivorans]
MRVLLLLLTLSCGLYLVSESYYRSHISMEGQYQARLSDLRVERNQLHEVIDATIQEETFQTDLYLEIDGIDSVSVFHSRGKFLQFKQGVYRYSAEITATQQADITNIETSDGYKDMLQRSGMEESGEITLLYLDKKIALVESGQQKNIYLYVRQP